MTSGSADLGGFLGLKFTAISPGRSLPRMAVRRVGDRTVA